jgi:hypothetical protein
VVALAVGDSAAASRIAAYLVAGTPLPDEI